MESIKAEVFGDFRQQLDAADKAQPHGDEAVKAALNELSQGYNSMKEAYEARRAEADESTAAVLEQGFNEMANKYSVTTEKLMSQGGWN